MSNILKSLQEETAERNSVYEANFMQLLPRLHLGELTPQGDLRMHQYLVFRLDQEPATVAHALQAFREMVSQLHKKLADFGDVRQTDSLLHFVCTSDRRLHAFQWILSEEYEA